MPQGRDHHNHSHLCHTASSVSTSHFFHSLCTTSEAVWETRWADNEIRTGSALLPSVPHTFRTSKIGISWPLSLHSHPHRRPPAVGAGGWDHNGADFFLISFVPPSRLRGFTLSLVPRLAISAFLSLTSLSSGFPAACRSYSQRMTMKGRLKS